MGVWAIAQEAKRAQSPMAGGTVCTLGWESTEIGL